MGVKRWDDAMLFRLAEIRGQGKTLKRAGEYFNISASRAGQLIRRASWVHYNHWKRANGWTTDGPGGMWVDPPNASELQKSYVAPEWSVFNCRP